MPRGDVRFNPYGNGNPNNRSTIPVQQSPFTRPTQQRPQSNLNVQTGRFGTGQRVVYPQQPTYRIPQPRVYVSQPVVHVPRPVVYTNSLPQTRNMIRVDDVSPSCAACAVLSVLLAVAAVALVIFGAILLAVLL